MSKELQALQLLSRNLQGAAFVVTCDMDNEAIEVRGDREDIIVMEINMLPSRVNVESLINVVGLADTVGRSWIFPTDMVVLGDHTTAESLEEIIDTWIPRIVNNGIMAFYHYEEEGYEFVKEIVDEKMARFEQIAMAGTLVAYKIIDDATSISWNMLISNKATAVVQ